MSLLMDALRQAEKGRAKGEGEDTATPEAAPETASPAAGAAPAGAEPGADLSLAPLDTPAAPTASDFEGLAEAETGSPEPSPQGRDQEVGPEVAAPPEPPASARPEAGVAAGPEPAAPASAKTGLSEQAQPERVQAERLVALTRARKAAARRRMGLMLGALGGVILLLLAGYGYLQMTAADDVFVPSVAGADVPGPEMEAVDAPPEQAATALPGPARLRPLSGPVEAAEPAAASPASPPVADPGPAAPAAAGGAAPVAPQAASGIRIRRVERPRPVDADLAAAFEAFRDGDLAGAAERYRQVLRREPGNRDAHMGLGAIALRQGDSAGARAHYREILRRDPTDTAALAALALSEGGGAADIGRLELQLQRHPDDAALHFALGSLHAQAGRWAEAQRAYFEAHRLAPERPEHAFNLAVALDHLGKPQAALGFYRRARELAAGRVVAFDRRALDRRIDQLSREAGS